LAKQKKKKRVLQSLKKLLCAMTSPNRLHRKKNVFFPSYVMGEGKRKESIAARDDI